MKMHVFIKKICRMFCQFKKSSYLCNRKREKTLSDANAKLRLAIKGPAPSSIG